MSSISPSPSVPIATPVPHLAVARSARLADAAQAGQNPSTQAGGSAATTPAKGSMSSDVLKKLVGDMQAKLGGAASSLEFSVDKDSGRSVVKVTDRATREVIWQFPSDQALQVSKELGQYMGALVNRRA